MLERTDVKQQARKNHGTTASEPATTETGSETTTRIEETERPNHVRAADPSAESRRAGLSSPSQGKAHQASCAIPRAGGEHGNRREQAGWIPAGPSGAESARARSGQTTEARKILRSDEEAQEGRVHGDDDLSAGSAAGVFGHIVSVVHGGAG